MNLIPRSVRQYAKNYAWLYVPYKKAERKLHHLKDWWGTKVWKRTTEVTTPLGFKLVSGYHPAYRQMRTGDFEVEETLIIRRMLGVASIFVDVGANLGYYTCLAAQEDKRTIAFEPQQHNLKCLMQNLVINGFENRVEIFPLALSGAPGVMTLYGASGPSASLVKGWAGYSSRHSQRIPVSTLDTVLGGRFEEERILIKIDVEGAEYQVLSGAHATLGRAVKPIWLVEVCLQEFHPEGANPDYQKIFDLFFDRGYAVYTATEPPAPVTRESVASWIQRRSSDKGTFNYVFIDKSLENHVLSSGSKPIDVAGVFRPNRVDRD